MAQPPTRRAVLDHRQVAATCARACWSAGRGTVSGRGAARCSVRQLRLVHMGDPHLAALRTEFTAEGWSGALEVESALDGDVTNAGVARYRDLDGRHLTDVRTGTAGPRTRCGCAAAPAPPTSAIAHGRPAHVADGAAVTPAHEPPARRARRTGWRCRSARTRPSPSTRPSPCTPPATPRSATRCTPPSTGWAARRTSTSCWRRTCTAWEQLWRRAELDVPGEAGRILRLHLFHVLQTLSPHTADLDVGVPARGLHGEAYRGHVFWDELFVLPYLNLHFPEVSRALLHYRHRRLRAGLPRPRATRAAAGAMYPWQSGSDGREETQQLHLNPRSGRWLPDHSRLQHHVGSAIAYNVWQYCEASGDTEFLHTKGAEMLLQIARFWADSAACDDELGPVPHPGRRRPRRVPRRLPGRRRGPASTTTRTPTSRPPGCSPAPWSCCARLPEPRRRRTRRAHRPGRGELERVGGRLPAAARALPRRASSASSRATATSPSSTGTATGARYGDIRRLDRILEAEGDSVNRYQASKQADVLMLGYLFSPAELQRPLPPARATEPGRRTWRRTVDYYLRRTSHGSTLSGLVHGWVLARARRADAWTLLPGGPARRHRRHPGRHHRRGHPPRRHGRHPRPGPARTDRTGDPRRTPCGSTRCRCRSCPTYGFSLRYRGHWGVGCGCERGRAGDRRAVVRYAARSRYGCRTAAGAGSGRARRAGWHSRTDTPNAHRIPARPGAWRCGPTRAAAQDAVRRIGPQARRPTPSFSGRSTAEFFGQRVRAAGRAGPRPSDGSRTPPWPRAGVAGPA